MGPDLKAQVERQLVADLVHYGLNEPGLTIDWSDATQEGHCTSYFGRNLESLSGLTVRNAAGKSVADGWMDFVHGGGNNPLFVFWLFLAIGSGDSRREVKTQSELPAHVWEQLPEASRDLCAASGRYDSKWSRDPKVIEWKSNRAS